MEMVKIFYYELRRLLGNRFTVGLLLVALLYGYWTMRGEILLGIANTAPFSPWSFGAYLAEMMPLLLVALLCFLSILTSDTGSFDCGNPAFPSGPLPDSVYCGHGGISCGHSSACDVRRWILWDHFWGDRLEHAVATPGDNCVSAFLAGHGHGALAGTCAS